MLRRGNTICDGGKDQALLTFTHVLPRRSLYQWVLVEHRQRCENIAALVSISHSVAAARAQMGEAQRHFIHKARRHVFDQYRLESELSVAYALKRNSALAGSAGWRAIFSA